MIRSMTAFARREDDVAAGRLVWELRAVNHRYLDVHPRLPDELRFIENDVRERVAGRLGRGKVDCVLVYRPDPGAAGTVAVNWPYAEQIIAACEALAERQGRTTPPSPVELLAIPGVLREASPDLEPVGERALAVLETALEDLVDARRREGERLAAIVRERADRVAALTTSVRQRRETVNRAVRDRLVARIEALGVQPEPGRLEQELVFIAQRLDVDEELERLQAHLSEVETTLARDEPVGRRLDFLMQELNREANTLSSKSSDAETTQAGVDIKVLIEQMREQVQNIE